MSSSVRPKRKYRKQVEFLRADLEWFNQTHNIQTDEDDDGYRTGLSALTSMLLHSYREVCENPAKHNLKGITPLELTLEAATIVRQEIEGDEEARSISKESSE